MHNNRHLHLAFQMYLYVVCKWVHDLYFMKKSKKDTPSQYIIQNNIFLQKKVKMVYIFEIHGTLFL